MELDKNNTHRVQAVPKTVRASHPCHETDLSDIRLESLEPTAGRRQRAWAEDDARDDLSAASPPVWTIEHPKDRVSIFALV